MSKFLFTKGHRHSNEVKNKISLANKGKHPWNYGLTGYKMPPSSEEKKRKIGLANKNRNKGIKPKYLSTPEVIEKIRKALKGKKFSPERVARLSQFRKGRRLSLETKRKLSELHRGSKHYNWKGGITTEQKKIRKGFKMRLWIRACLERDDFTCQITGQRGGKLAVHHINNFADYPELRTSLENGITLSKEVHIEFHHIYGNKNNTREQLEEFISQKKLGSLQTAL